LSESEQDALLAKIERGRQRGYAFKSIMIAMLVLAAVSAVLYLASTFHV